MCRAAIAAQIAVGVQGMQAERCSTDRSSASLRGQRPGYYPQLVLQTSPPTPGSCARVWRLRFQAADAFAHYRRSAMEAGPATSVRIDEALPRNAFCHNGARDGLALRAMVDTPPWRHIARRIVLVQ